MAPVETYVFVDLETTGMPQEESNKTKITEICLIAVKRSHVLETRIGGSPRVQQKLTLCLNPGKLIQPTCTEVTGLCNDLLEHEPSFDMNIFTMINTFLSVLTKPVCLIAQNGMNFDFPILKNHLIKLDVSFNEELLCADCFHGFYDILEKNTPNLTEIPPVNDLNDTSKFNLEELQLINEEKYAREIKLKNETTPKKPTRHQAPPKLSRIIKNENSKARRKFPWSEGSKPTKPYKLKHIYERVLNRPSLESHRAESDCVMALEISVALHTDFVKWVDSNYCLFSEIKPMTVGIPLGK